MVLESGEHVASTRLEAYPFMRNFTPFSGFFSMISEPLYDIKNPAIQFYPAMASRFGFIMDEIIKDNYGDVFWGNRNQTDLEIQAVENKYLNGEARHTFFTPWDNSTMVVVD